MTLSVNDTVLYGAHGVCRITGTTVKNFSGEKHEYYVLKPVYQENSTLFIPMDNSKLLSKIRRILSSEEIISLIHELHNEELDWNENESERKQNYSDIISSGDRRSLMKLIRSVYNHRTSLEENGKKLHQCDERAFKEAEKLLYDEFATVLNIDPEQVLPFIIKELDGETTS